MDNKTLAILGLGAVGVYLLTRPKAPTLVTAKPIQPISPLVSAQNQLISQGITTAGSLISQGIQALSNPPSNTTDQTQLPDDSDMTLDNTMSGMGTTYSKMLVRKTVI